MVPLSGEAFTIDKPADGKNFVSADLFNGKTPVQLDKKDNHIILTLPDGVKWDPVDTVIELKAHEQK
jgi:hypothetical protein